VIWDSSNGGEFWKTKGGKENETKNLSFEKE
jgi:hypothetical protein